MLSATYNDWTLVSLSPLPALWQGLAAAAVIVAVALVLRSYRGARRRWLLSALRLLAAALIIGFLIEPALQLRVVRKVRNRLAVVVDRSESMTLNTEDGRSRYDHLLAKLEAEREGLTALNQSHVVDWLDLDGPTNAAALSTPPAGELSDLVGALERARDTGAGRPLAGVVLLSDGADNLDLAGAATGLLPEAVQQRLERIGAPINTVSVASAESFQDVAVLDVRADEFAFVHNTIEIEVTLESIGLGSLMVPVTLRREGEVLATQEAVLAQGKPSKLTFSTKPDQIGEFVYSVDVPAVAGEAIDANNRRAFVLRVIRDKIRVLHVAGRPSWDERFLRQHLKENPNVDLISFFILRTKTDVPGAGEDELSLIPFPVDKLFTTELKSFDIIVFQNFDYRPYNMAQYLPNIRDAVQGGLGFVMIGGDQSFDGGGYAGTAVEEIVPLRLEAGELLETAAAPELTEAGRRHPVTDLVRGAGSNERLWTRMPGWTSINRTSGLVPGATALVVDRTAKSLDGKPAPLVAAMDAGQGRALAIASDSMWRWRFANHRDGGAAERAYHRFWSNAMHWLVRDPEHSRIRVLPDKRRFEAGEQVEVAIVVRGHDYQPVPQAHLRVTLSQTGVGVLRVDDVVTGDSGAARQRYSDLPRGAYRVTVTAQAGAEELGSGTGVFLVEERSVELTRGAPRPDLLAAMSRATGGAASTLERPLWSALEVIDPDVVEVDRRRNLELWDNAWALVAGILLLAFEWAVRRRSGYL